VIELLIHFVPKSDQHNEQHSNDEKLKIAQDQPRKRNPRARLPALAGRDLPARYVPMTSAAMPSGGMSAIKLSPRLAIAILLTTGAAVAAAVDCTGTRGTGLEGAALWQALGAPATVFAPIKIIEALIEDKTWIEPSRKVERDR
jgi:hypothetical protein